MWGWFSGVFGVLAQLCLVAAKEKIRGFSGRPKNMKYHELDEVYQKKFHELFFELTKSQHSSMFLRGFMNFFFPPLIPLFDYRLTEGCEQR